MNYISHLEYSTCNLQSNNTNVFPVTVLKTILTVAVPGMPSCQEELRELKPAALLYVSLFLV